MRSRQIEIAGQPVLVFAPSERVEIGRQRLRAMREGPSYSALDVGIERAFLLADPRPEVLVLRGADDHGEPLWRFAPDLTLEEQGELGYRLLREQLPVYRDLTSRGVLLFAKTDFGPREAAAMDEGRARLLAELEAAPTPTDRLDAWILRNLSYWLIASLADATPFLERTIRALPPRRGHVRRLLAAVREAS